MNGTSPTGLLGALTSWIMETCGFSPNRDSERKRLASLSMKQHHEDCNEEIGAHTVAVPINEDVRAAFGHDKDNYLTGELIRGKRDEEARHSREILTNWLHQGECLGCKTNGTYRDHDCGKNSQWDGEVEYEKKDSRLVDFSEIGLGMSRDNLTKFVFDANGQKSSHPEARVSENAQKKTVQDLPAMQFNFDRVESIQADAANRQANSHQS